MELGVVYSVVAVCDSSMGVAVVVCSVLVPPCKATGLARLSRADPEDMASGAEADEATKGTGAEGDQEAGGRVVVVVVVVVVPLVIVAVVAEKLGAT